MGERGGSFSYHHGFPNLGVRWSNGGVSTWKWIYTMPTAAARNEKAEIHINKMTL